MSKHVDLIRVRNYGDSSNKNTLPVVMLHGGPGAPGEMAPVCEYLANNINNNQFRIFEPLQRSSGDGIKLSVAQHVADLHNILHKSTIIMATEDNKPGINQVRLVGYSWGAALALTYAARYPDDVEKVILIGCGTFDKISRKTYQISIQKRMTDMERDRIQKIKIQLNNNETNQKYRDKLLAEIGAIYTRIQSHKPIINETAVVDDDHHYHQLQQLDCDEIGFRDTWDDVLKLQEKGIQPGEFVTITAPVTMLHGIYDPHPGHMIYECLAAHIKNIKYREIQKCGHTPWKEIEAKNTFYTLLEQCLH